ncbi:hypothetical protein L9F63_005508, partial [Diploptera punctata]
SKLWRKFYSTALLLFNTNIANSCFMMDKERTTVKDKQTNFVMEFVNSYVYFPYAGL